MPTWFISTKTPKSIIIYAGGYVCFVATRVPHEQRTQLWLKSAVAGRGRGSARLWRCLDVALLCVAGGAAKAQFSAMVVLVCGCARAVAPAMAVPCWGYARLLSAVACRGRAYWPAVAVGLDDCLAYCGCKCRCAAADARRLRLTPPVICSLSQSTQYCICNSLFPKKNPSHKQRSLDQKQLVELGSENCVSLA